MVAADREGGAAGIQRHQTQRLPQHRPSRNKHTECRLHWSVHLPLATRPLTSPSTLYQNRRLPTSPTSFSLATLPDPTSRTTRHTPKAFFLYRGSVRRAGRLDGCCTGHGSLSRRCRNTSQPRLRLTRDTPCMLLVAGSRKIPKPQGLPPLLEACQIETQNYTTHLPGASRAPQNLLILELASCNPAKTDTPSSRRHGAVDPRHQPPLFALEVAKQHVDKQLPGY
ncbi:hypothetical protein IWZ03DRAFT_31180 [Phyllosticta citriasiana]|uniref:Uncharacterized protein n=1 Tax=Phyllosticta citriasiana TaxID=595635 RepID=A0ABR1L0V1_9PEZI